MSERSSGRLRSVRHGLWWVRTSLESEDRVSNLREFERSNDDLNSFAAASIRRLEQPRRRGEEVEGKE